MTLTPIPSQLIAGAGCKAKAVKVQFQRCSICVEVAGESILEGKLGGPIDVEESVWTLSNGVLEITLAKVDNDKYQCKWADLFEE